jgi:hypothetical protein
MRFAVASLLMGAIFALASAQPSHAQYDPVSKHWLKEAMGCFGQCSIDARNACSGKYGDAATRCSNAHDYPCRMACLAKYRCDSQSHCLGPR